MYDHSEARRHQGCPGFWSHTKVQADKEKSRAHRKPCWPRPFLQTSSCQHVSGHLLITQLQLSWLAAPGPMTGYSVRKPSRQPPPLVHLLREPCFPGTDPKLRCCMTCKGWGTLANLTFSPAPQVQVFRRLEGAADVGSLVHLLGLLRLLTSSVVKPRGHGRSLWKSGAQFHLCH